MHYLNHFRKQEVSGTRNPTLSLIRNTTTYFNFARHLQPYLGMGLKHYLFQAPFLKTAVRRLKLYSSSEHIRLTQIFFFGICMNCLKYVLLEMLRSSNNRPHLSYPKKNYRVKSGSANPYYRTAKLGFS